MSRRRRLAFASVFAVPLVMLAFACSFPEVSFVDPAGEAGAESSAVFDAPAETSLPDAHVSEDGEALSDGGLVGDAAARDEAAAPLDPVEAGCEAKCDCDDDGFFKIGCDAATPADTPMTRVGGGDCLDFDKEVRPNQGKFFDEVPTPPNMGDYNCADGVEKGYPETRCAGLSLNCSGETFNGAVGCGVESAWYVCTPDLLGCKAVLKASEPSRRQACR